MNLITSRHIDDMYDAGALLQLISQDLSEGEISDNTASDMAWLLGSMKKRLGDILSLMEKIQRDQEDAAGDTSKEARA